MLLFKLRTEVIYLKSNVIKLQNKKCDYKIIKEKKYDLLTNKLKMACYIVFH